MIRKAEPKYIFQDNAGLCINGMNEILPISSNLRMVAVDLLGGILPISKG